MKDEALALLNWYPFYGKLKLSDRKVLHFDVYALGGGGQARLLSGRRQLSRRAAESAFGHSTFFDPTRDALAELHR